MKKICYTVILQSQLGPRAGELLLQEDEATGAVSGELCLLGRRNRLSGSVLQNGKFLISGALRSQVVRRNFYRAAGPPSGRTGDAAWVLGLDGRGAFGCAAGADSDVSSVRMKKETGEFFQKFAVFAMRS